MEYILSIILSLPKSFFFSSTPHLPTYCYLLLHNQDLTDSYASPPPCFIDAMEMAGWNLDKDAAVDAGLV